MEKITRRGALQSIYTLRLIKSMWLNGTCSTHWRKKVRNHRGKYHSRDTGVYKRILSIWKFDKQNVTCQKDRNAWAQGQTMALYVQRQLIIWNTVNIYNPLNIYNFVNLQPLATPRIEQIQSQKGKNKLSLYLTKLKVKAKLPLCFF